MPRAERLGCVLLLSVFRGEWYWVHGACAGKMILTVSSAAVEEDLGGLCGACRDFDDVGVSPAGTAAA